MSNFMKIRPVGVELFHADGQTDMTKLIFTFRNFAKAPTITVINCFPILYTFPSKFHENPSVDYRVEIRPHR